VPYVKTDDIVTYYEVYGEGYPLVFIHGGWSDHEIWRPQIKYFSSSYEIIVYDLRGYGKTSESGIKKHSLELLADDLKALLEALSIEKPIICGRSLGGLIAQAYAIKYPDLKALILANTSPITPFSFSDKIRRRLEKPIILANTGIAHLIGVKRFVNLGFKVIKMFHGEKRISVKKDVLKHVQETLINLSEDEFFKLFNMFLTSTSLDFSEIKVPTLIIVGEFEPKVALKQAEKIKRVLRNSSVAIISKAGHFSNVDNPKEFNEVIVNFLKQLRFFKSQKILKFI